MQIKVIMNLELIEYFHTYFKSGSMNVLMFGWEFPPNISGGLGTACFGIVKGLATCRDVNVTFIVPKAHGNEQSARNLRLLSADNISVGSQFFPEGKPTTVRFLEVPSQLVPYLTPESFDESYQLSSEIKEKSPAEVVQEGQKIHFSGAY